MAQLSAAMIATRPFIQHVHGCRDTDLGLSSHHCRQVLLDIVLLACVLNYSAPQVKPNKKEASAASITKDGVQIVMNARCWCNDHILPPSRAVLDLQDYVPEWNQVGDLYTGTIRARC